jgi:hypothetical protein
MVDVNVAGANWAQMMAGRKLDTLGVDEVFGEPRHFEHATGSGQ